MAGLFGGASPPPPKPVVPMPDEEGPEVKEAERRKRAEILARGGRRSTILSQATEMPSYSRATMGGG